MFWIKWNNLLREIVFFPKNDNLKQSTAWLVVILTSYNWQLRMLRETPTCLIDTMDLFTVADIWKNVSHRSKQTRSCDTSKALRPCFYTVILKAAVANLILYTHKLKEFMIYVTILHWIVLSKLLSLHFAFEQQYKIYLRKQSSTYKSM